MILKNQLYRIEQLQTTDEATNFTVSLIGSCFIYKAHFPGNPITPGVCIVQTARELLQELVGRGLEITEARDVKFLNILSPTDRSRVTFTLTDVAEADGHVKAKVSVHDDDFVFCTIAFTCA